MLQTFSLALLGTVTTSSHQIFPSTWLLAQCALSEGANAVTYCPGPCGLKAHQAQWLGSGLGLSVLCAVR